MSPSIPSPEGSLRASSTNSLSLTTFLSFPFSTIMTSSPLKHWNGSCLTSPSKAPAWAPVASTNGALFLPELSTSNLGTIAWVLNLMLAVTIKATSITNTPRRRVLGSPWLKNTAIATMKNTKKRR
ncbi:125aa long hypothetical protein [Pyrococcus horikoshii OT3]|uniref:Uncharacterized protein n=1 Tax=Pyrococcus horikoshii (strain ATCC 700860 / DSM 12428 / JCM 9974 / NBRC 100139 / OT-3) TaxID=70601 RepID=O58173_PYRHO|nr:125aa long hypothetical protein [Pyrococcus horikoshii OT3]